MSPHAWIGETNVGTKINVRRVLAAPRRETRRWVVERGSACDPGRNCDRDHDPDRDPDHDHDRDHDPDHDHDHDPDP